MNFTNVLWGFLVFVVANKVWGSMGHQAPIDSAPMVEMKTVDPTDMKVNPSFSANGPYAERNDY